MKDRPAHHTTTPFSYRRRFTREVFVADLGIGGNHPIRIQSMTTPDTMDTIAVVEQTLRLEAAGCELVRITAPGKKDAANLGIIKKELRKRGCNIPLVADIHFAPAAAMEAALHVEKIRINPGNYADSKRFKVKEYDDAEYQKELERVGELVRPLILRCRELGRAMRIGVNHGSLSDRIMNRFGDTPEGMVECALEFIHFARREDYHDIVVSMKASNPEVMIRSYRLLITRFAAEGMDYPLHLGVTEAGDGKDGRIKSAMGIGSLLEDGIGDTIRVSLTEDPVFEIPAARYLASRYNDIATIKNVGNQSEHNISEDDIENQNECNSNATVSTSIKAYHLRSQELREGQLHRSGLKSYLESCGLKESHDAMTSFSLRKNDEILILASIEFINEAISLSRSGCDIIFLQCTAAGLKYLPHADAQKTKSSIPPIIPDIRITNMTEMSLLKKIDCPVQKSYAGISLQLGSAMLKLLGTDSKICHEFFDILCAIAPDPTPLFLHLYIDSSSNSSSDSDSDSQEFGARKHKMELPSGLQSFLNELFMRRSRAAVLSIENSAYRFDRVARELDTTAAMRLLFTTLCSVQEKFISNEGCLPVPLIYRQSFATSEQALYGSSLACGSLLLDGIAGGLAIHIEKDSDGQAATELALDILQSARLRMTRADFISCPSCGRTLFDIQEVTARIRKRTGHLAGVKIAIMGCIVNGPGEMADADFGYVGAGPGRVHLYRKKDLVKSNVQSEIADEELINLIKEHGFWHDPE